MESTFESIKQPEKPNIEILIESGRKRCNNCNLEFSQDRQKFHERYYHSPLPENISEVDEKKKKVLFCDLCQSKIKRTDLFDHNGIKHPGVGMIECSRCHNKFLWFHINYEENMCHMCVHDKNKKPLDYYEKKYSC